MKAEAEGASNIAARTGFSSQSNLDKKFGSDSCLRPPHLNKKRLFSGDHDNPLSAYRQAGIRQLVIIKDKTSQINEDPRSPDSEVSASLYLKPNGREDTSL